MKIISGGQTGVDRAALDAAIGAQLDYGGSVPEGRMAEDGPIDVKYVKIFEYVPGARIKGDGIIELPLVSNTGRAFVYRQQSTNGEFVVPYSTEGNPYDVRATGKYKITGTGRQISVSEDAIMRGLQIT